MASRKQIPALLRSVAPVSRRRVLGAFMALAALSALPVLRLGTRARPTNGWVLRKDDH